MTRNTPSRSSGSSGKGARKGAATPGKVARPRWGKPVRPAATDRDGFTAQTAPLAPGEPAPARPAEADTGKPKADRTQKTDRAQKAERTQKAERSKDGAPKGDRAQGSRAQASRTPGERPRKQAVRPPKALRTAPRGARAGARTGAGGA
ncbi:hypothetical protein ACFV6I_37065, partial [Kitasatospora sp. NPDC059803]